MKLITSIITATLLAAGTGAQANITPWFSHDVVEASAQFKVSDSNSFTDYFTFSLSSQAELLSTSVANNIQTEAFNITHISEGWVDLYYGIYGDQAADTLVGGYSFNGGSGDNVNSFSSLSAGNYFYKVTGIADGKFGGFYTISSAIKVAPIPEPETYALLLAGLGATVIARRAKTRK